MGSPRRVLVGENDRGDEKIIPIDSNQHLEVAIHSPRNPFGSIHAEKLTPVVQHDAVYGIDSIHNQATAYFNGTATNGGGMFVCTTGTTLYGAGIISSTKRLRYRPGQGVVVRFTGLFTTGVASSYQLIGAGHAESGVYFGYKAAAFGILHVTGGVREIQTLTVSVGSAHTENVVVTLDGTEFNVPVTNSSSTVKTAYEISQYASYVGWYAEQVGSTVVFLASSAGNKTTGVFTLAGTSATGTFAETLAGVASTDTFYPQTTWNGDKLDGSGPSGMTLNPTKLNVYQIQIQYLGAGAVTFQVENAPDGNNADWIQVHAISFPNTITTPTFSNPTFPFLMTAYSQGSTTNLTVKSASYAGFIEGEIKLHGNRLSYYNQSTAVTAAAYQALFTIRNGRVFYNRANQATINVISISGAQKHDRPMTIYLIKNATLAGTPNFAQYASSSCSFVDSSATTATFSSNDQLVWSGTLGDTGNFEHEFPDSITIQPGETMTVAAKTSFGTPSYVIAAMNTREDQ